MRVTVTIAVPMLTLSVTDSEMELLPGASTIPGVRHAVLRATQLESPRIVNSNGPLSPVVEFVHWPEAACPASQVQLGGANGPG